VRPSLLSFLFARMPCVCAERGNTRRHCLMTCLPLPTREMLRAAGGWGLRAGGGGLKEQGVPRTADAQVLAIRVGSSARFFWRLSVRNTTDRLPHPSAQLEPPPTSRAPTFLSQGGAGRGIAATAALVSAARICRRPRASRAGRSGAHASARPRASTCGPGFEGRVLAAMRVRACIRPR